MVDGNDPSLPVRAARIVMTRLGLPTELVLYILDLADYHPTLHGQRTGEVRLNTRAGPIGPSRAAKMYILTAPIPGAREGEFWRVRRMTWRIEGHDQGWGGDHPGGWDGAYSWYEASIFRYDLDASHDNEPDLDDNDVEDALAGTLLHKIYQDPDVGAQVAPFGWSMVTNEKDGSKTWTIQKNRVADNEYEKYEVVWADDEDRRSVDLTRGAGGGEGFLQALRPGDRIGLWMRAKYPGWQNYLKEAGFELMYEFY